MLKKKKLSFHLFVAILFALRTPTLFQHLVASDGRIGRAREAERKNVLNYLNFFFSVSF